MERPGHENCPCMETCPLNRALGLIGGKWKMQILCALSNNGPTRYNRLKKTLDGVSNTVLANALRELEGDGLVHRQEYLEVPVRVEYAITEPCRRLPVNEDGTAPGGHASLGAPTTGVTLCSRAPDDSGRYSVYKDIA